MEYFEIVTPRLKLRPIGMGDLLTAHAYASDAENCRYMMFLPKDTLEETRQFIGDCVAEWAKAAPGYCEFAVVRSGEHIGGMSLELLEAPGTAELGWVLRADCHGHGYATEAALALMDEAQRRFNIRRFIAHCDAENLASQGVMRKLGMTLADDTGTRRNRGSDEERRELRFEREL